MLGGADPRRTPLVRSRRLVGLLLRMNLISLAKEASRGTAPLL
jgi:hypothetical protein